MKDYPNIIIILVDTLRKDVLPIYGGKATTPNLDKFSEDAVVFYNAVAPAPWTVPSHMSLFTGFYPNEHKVDISSMKSFLGSPDDELFKKIKNQRSVRIPERLNRIGYSTIGLSSNPYISPGSGFDRYFDLFSYVDSLPYYNEAFEFSDEMKKYGHNKLEVAKNVLKRSNLKTLYQYYRTYRSYHKMDKQNGNFPRLKGARLSVEQIINSSYTQPFFLFVNFIDVHEPVSKWEIKPKHKLAGPMDLLGLKTIPERLMEKTKADYRVTLTKLDNQIGRLIGDLKKKKVYDDSLIIITSDHGQAFKERRKIPYYGHGYFLYDELIEIPLIIKLPMNRKLVQKAGYQSLTSIYKFIVNIIDENYEDQITSRAVFSEGPQYINDLEQIKPNSPLKDKINFDTISKILYAKKAVYKDGYKLVVNGTDGSIDEFTYKGKVLDFNDYKVEGDDLLNELENFVGNEGFVVNKKR